MKSKKKPYKSKINKIRTFALSLIFIGFIVMYGAIIFRDHKWVAMIFIALGMLCIIASTVVYAWIGLLSTQAIMVECPNCHKHTKMLGRVDMCMFCNEPLTLDKSLEGKEFNQDYNNKTKQHKKNTVE